MGSENVIILERFNGRESFEISDATIAVSHDEVTGLPQVIFQVSSKKAIETLPDTTRLKAWPNAEVCIQLSNFELRNFVGSKYRLLQGMPEDADGRLGRFYYVRHEDLDQNELEILSRKESSFHVTWSGVTKDVNYYDGSKPLTRVAIDGWFRFRNIDQWEKS
jgi:hypothetical protein